MHHDLTSGLPNRHFEHHFLILMNQITLAAFSICQTKNRYATYSNATGIFKAPWTAKVAGLLPFVVCNWILIVFLFGPQDIVHSDSVPSSLQQSTFIVFPVSKKYDQVGLILNHVYIFSNGIFE
jgi:hypothetical protein